MPAKHGRRACAGCRGMRAKTDRIDAELIAPSMAFRPAAGPSLPREKMRFFRVLPSKRGQLAETRKRLLAQRLATLPCNTLSANGSRRLANWGRPICLRPWMPSCKACRMARSQSLRPGSSKPWLSYGELAAMASNLRSVPGIGPVASTMLSAEMPEPGQFSGEQAAALVGLAPRAHDSGVMHGKRAIGGGCRPLRHVMFQAALVARHHKPVLKVFADRLRDAGKTHKVLSTAVARTLVTIVNAFGTTRQK